MPSINPWLYGLATSNHLERHAEAIVDVGRTLGRSKAAIRADVADMLRSRLPQINRSVRITKPTAQALADELLRELARRKQIAW